MDNQITNERIGKRVAQLRKKHHLTQAKLADLVGSTPKHISEIERGVTGISIDIQIQLSEKLYCSIDYLIKGREFRSVDSALPPYIVELIRSGQKDELRLLTDYLKIYESIRKK